MKFVPAQITSLIRGGTRRRNLRVLLRFLLVLLGMITLYSVIFHALMEREGQQFSWITSFYWTLTVMSTLGFGDITFQTDLGRVFSMVVLLSGMVFLLVLLPFTFIEFFYEPWMEAQAAQRAPRELPKETRNHVLLTHYDEVTSALIRRLQQFDFPYAVLVPDMEEALRMHDENLRVVVGELDDPEVYEKLRVDHAALVVTTASDTLNTNVAFTVRGVSETVPIVSTAKEEASADILSLAGSNYVLRLEDMLGQAFSRRTIGNDAIAHVIGRFDELVIAEAMTRRTPLVGKTIRECGLRENVGVSILGIWEQGEFHNATAETSIHEHSVLVLGGSQEHMDRYNELFLIYNQSTAPVLILGGGRVGRATARALTGRGQDYRIVEQHRERVRSPDKCVVGNAAELEVLKRAGIDKAPTVVITTHDDDMNIYLTVYCRRLRPDVQIISRVVLERNMRTLRRAGADIVMSYASMGASAMLNVLKRGRLLLLPEGLEIFRVVIPESLAGKTLAESKICSRSGCGVVALKHAGVLNISPDPETPLPAESELLVIGTGDAEETFLDRYGASLRADD